MIATRNGNLAIVTELLQNGKHDKDFINAQEKVILSLMLLLSVTLSLTLSLSRPLRRPSSPSPFSLLSPHCSLTHYHSCIIRPQGGQLSSLLPRKVIWRSLKH